MALLNAYTLIRIYVAAHLTIGYLLLTNPRILAEQTFIFIMGESLGLVRNSPLPLLPGVLLYSD